MLFQYCIGCQKEQKEQIGNCKHIYETIILINQPENNPEISQCEINEQEHQINLSILKTNTSNHKL